MEIIAEKNVAVPLLATLLRQGKTLAYPTETCYGLGCDATNTAAVGRVFEIKKRQKDKPVLVIFSSVEMAMAYVPWSPLLEKIADRYWPGPLTVVVPMAEHALLAPGVVGRDHTIAFRISGYDFVRDVVEELKAPLVSTSANIASLESPYDIEGVISMFSREAEQPDIIIDAGPLPHHNPSTIVRIDEGKIQVLRQGEVHFDYF